MIKKVFAVALILLAALSCSDKNKEKTDNSKFSKQTNWKASIEKIVSEGYGNYIKLNISAPGSTFMSVNIFTDEDIKKDFENGTIEEIANEFKENLDHLLQSDKIEDILWTEKEEIYTPYTTSGPAHVYIIDFDEHGALSGKYAIIDVNVPELEEGEGVEGVIAGTVSLQSSWRATLADEIMGDEEYGYYTFLDVTAPGATYFWCDGYTSEEMDYYYDGSVSELLLDYSANAKKSLASGDTMGDIYWIAGAGEDVWMDVYDSGETDIYIMDFNASGDATGKYGKTHVTIPEFGSKSKGVKTPLRVKIRRHTTKRTGLSL